MEHPVPYFLEEYSKIKRTERRNSQAAEYEINATFCETTHPRNLGTLRAPSPPVAPPVSESDFRYTAAMNYCASLEEKVESLELQFGSGAEIFVGGYSAGGINSVLETASALTTGTTTISVDNLCKEMRIQAATQAAEIIKLTTAMAALAAASTKGGVRV